MPFQEVDPFDAPTTYDDLVTLAEAAKRTATSLSRLQGIVDRAKIQPVHHNERGCAQFVLWDIIEAELDALDAA